MTREEAIVIIGEHKKNAERLAGKTLAGQKSAEAFNMAIEALSISEIPNKCEDTISRQAAIKAMNNLEQEDIERYGCSIPEGFDGKRAIEALKKLPSVTPKLAECEDAISRQAVLDLVVTNHKELNGVNVVMYSPLCKDIKQLPPITPKQKMGRWIMSDDGLYRPICDNCGAHPWKGYIPTVEEATKVFEYCPKCGAKMAESED